MLPFDFIFRLRRFDSNIIALTEEIMVWIASLPVSGDELREVAQEIGLAVDNNFITFACFVAEKCAAIADAASAAGKVDVGQEIRAAFATCWPAGSLGRQHDDRGR